MSLTITMGRDWMNRALLLGLVFIVAGCATDYSGITALPDDRDATGLLEYRTFQLETRDLPVFLGPVIVSNFSVAMAERGYQPVTRDGDAIARVSYLQENLPHGEGVDEVRFVARVRIELLDAGSLQEIFSGSIQRLHTVSAGEYMHVGDASISFLQAFRELLSGIPARTPVDQLEQ